MSEDLLAELERLKAENEELKKGQQKGIHLKVSEKGAVSVYGLGRFPVTLYKSQWQRLFAAQDAIKAFIIENNHLLKSRD
jgi:hypothetical protein